MLKLLLDAADQSVVQFCARVKKFKVKSQRVQSKRPRIPKNGREMVFSCGNDRLEFRSGAVGRTDYVMIL